MIVNFIIQIAKIQKDPSPQKGKLKSERSPFFKPGCAWCLALKGRAYSKKERIDRDE
jgi:hypothetical protein